MKNYIIVFLCLFLQPLYAQEALIKDVSKFYGVDIYEHFYYLKNELLHKSNQTQTYYNVLFGPPTSVDISNPLQLLCFYKNVNTVVVLDNLLNPILQFQIPLGVSHICSAGTDKIWMYDTITQQFSLFNFKNNLVELSAIPLQLTIKSMKGNLNNLFVLNAANELLTFNYYGRIINTTPNTDFVYSISLQPNNYLNSAQIKSLNSTYVWNITNQSVVEIFKNYFYYLKEDNILYKVVLKN